MSLHKLQWKGGWLNFKPGRQSLEVYARPDYACNCYFRLNGHYILNDTMLKDNVIYLPEVKPLLTRLATCLMSLPNYGHGLYIRSWLCPMSVALGFVPCHILIMGVVFIVALGFVPRKTVVLLNSLANPLWVKRGHYKPGSLHKNYLWSVIG